MVPTQTPNPEVVRRKELTREEEDQEIDDLVRLHGLSVQGSAYKILYARCAHRFPNVAKTLPMLIIREIPCHHRPSLHAKHRQPPHTLSGIPPVTHPEPNSSDSQKKKKGSHYRVL